MWKKILSAIIISQIVLTSVFAADTSELRAAFDELNYTLTVEWDQNDPAIVQKALKDFSSIAKTSTALERSEFMRSLLPGKEHQVNNFVHGLDSMANEEAVNKLRDLSGVYTEGASYRPGKYIAIGVGVAATIFLAGLLMWELGDPQIFGEDGWK